MMHVFSLALATHLAGVLLASPLLSRSTILLLYCHCIVCMLLEVSSSHFDRSTTTESNGETCWEPQSSLSRLMYDDHRISSLVSLLGVSHQGIGSREARAVNLTAGSLLYHRSPAALTLLP